MKRTISIMLAIAMLLSLVACGKNAAEKWQEQYDLGVRYLSDGNYEEAIIAFTAAIEIEPRQAEAYVSLADAYMGCGDYEQAESIIEKGRDMCGDLEDFDRFMENLSFLQSGEAGIRITSFYFDKEAYLSGAETDFLVSVAYRCPENMDCILMIGANTDEPYSFSMMEKDYAVSGSGGYQFFVSAQPIQWEDAYFGIYVNLSEADHEESWTPIDSDELYIDPAGNVVDGMFYDNAGYSDDYDASLLEQGITDHMLRAEEILFLGNPIANMNITAVENILRTNGFSIETNEAWGSNDDYWWVQGSLDSSAHISALQYKNEESLSLLGYDDYGDRQDNLPIGIRDVYTGDSFATVFTKLGFSNGYEIESMIMAMANQEEELDDFFSREFSMWYNGCMISSGSRTSTVLENGDYQILGFGVQFYFDELPQLSISMEFGDRSSETLVPILSGYSIHYASE